MLVSERVRCTAVPRLKSYSTSICFRLVPPNITHKDDHSAHTLLLRTRLRGCLRMCIELVVKKATPTKPAGSPNGLLDRPLCVVVLVTAALRLIGVRVPARCASLFERLSRPRLMLSFWASFQGGGWVGLFRFRRPYICVKGVQYLYYMSFFPSCPDSACT